MTGERGASQVPVVVVSALLLVGATVGVWWVLRTPVGAPAMTPTVAPTVSVATATSLTPSIPPSPAAPAASGAPRAPTAADAADFAVAYRPPGATQVETIAADVDGDGSDEVVVTSVVDGRTRVDVAAWTGAEYALTFTGEGGEADTIARLAVRDVNDSPETREIITTQTLGDDRGSPQRFSRQSLSLWGWDGTAYTPLRAVEGCWAGSHTYGIIGASIQTQRITASCDGSPEPPETWPDDIYVWDPETSAFVYEITEENG